jgi:intein/homing endonuclease
MGVILKLRGLEEPRSFGELDPILSLKREDVLCSRASGLCKKGYKSCCVYTTKHGETKCYKVLLPYGEKNRSITELELGDFIGYSINTDNNSPGFLRDYFNLEDYWVFIKNELFTYDGIKKRKILDNFRIDECFLELCGWYVSEGCGVNRLVRFTLNEKEIDYIDSITAAIEKIGRNFKVYPKGDHAVDVAVVSVALSKFFKDNFGAGAKNKKIPEWVKNLSPDYLRSFLKGVFHGDGCDNRYRLVYACASHRLIKDIFDVLLKFRCISSTTKYFNRSIKNTRDESGHRLTYGDRTLPMFRLECSTAQNKELFKYLGFRLKEEEKLSSFRHLFVGDKVFISIKEKSYIA